ncbi:hepatitis A virus cellular receptor 1 [Clarias magur]|uniref:Hepatitis A virus cellular receptor 1 n=1 Tax=Clarias magur TaxID=1594786 RepID=A0A8J4TIM7_CLAMG|nr:hepatitis A virus cellular receptor 1 [Clarias magur]
MNQLHRWIFSLGLLLCLIACTRGAKTVYGFEGQEVTLPCNYDSKYHGICHVCWMRGSIPNQGCGVQVVYANEKQVVMRGDARYQLRGALQHGDASLTILKAKKSDSGKYGCRVHVPGWFNDKKFEMYLEIMEATQRPTTTPRYVTTAAHVTHMQHKTATVPQLTTTKRPGTTSTRRRHITTTALIYTEEETTGTLENGTTAIHTVTDETEETTETLENGTTAIHTVTHAEN